jgi:hypothetical protein
MARLTRFLPFTSFGGAAWFAYRHRRPIWDWGSWAVHSVPRLVEGERSDVLVEARLRLRLANDERLAGDRIHVEVEGGCAHLTGQVAKGHREIVAELTEHAPGVTAVDDDLQEQRRRRGRRPVAA